MRDVHVNHKHDDGLVDGIRHSGCTLLRDISVCLLIANYSKVKNNILKNKEQTLKSFLHLYIKMEFP